MPEWSFANDQEKLNAAKAKLQKKLNKKKQSILKSLSGQLVTVLVGPTEDYISYGPGEVINRDRFVKITGIVNDVLEHGDSFYLNLHNIEEIDRNYETIDLSDIQSIKTK